MSRSRQIGRALLRPIWLRLWRLIERRVVALLDARRPQDEAWQQHIPAFLNAVSTVGAFGHELLRYRKESLAGLAAIEDETEALRARLAALENLRDEPAKLAERIEFVRREILFEMRFAAPGRTTQGGAAPQAIEPRIVAEAKLADARRAGLRLNLGCGHIVLDDYVNIDARALPGIDIIAEAGDLPLEHGSVQEIRSAHLLEHFPQEELRRRLLPYWFSLLAPGGCFTAIVPDGNAMLRHSAAGDYPFEQFREVLFGAQDYQGDFHFNMFTPGSLTSLLDEVGFVDITVPVEGRRNGLCFEFEINARRL